MTGTVNLDDSDWEVPSYDAAIFAEKAHNYALVIPVINEGDRIRGQLSRIKDAELPVDVIVADGGSNDGSLDAEFVGPIGVRAVLTKTGAGKLSAQLRMAYAWCLREGYTGIVTIDGNGKDGVEAVAEFAAKLDQGCDYVQGSRYLPGGEAENTPLERTIANRLIHAPVLSLAGRHIFTDTTNGFRAYSARYLTHPEVLPFRDEFKVYNLLFYLTVRAGQLGLKVNHVPVVRRYPENGKVPTKIGGFGSKLALLGETVTAATGGYTPDASLTQKASLGWAGLIAAFVLLPLLFSVIAAPNYSPDSWAMYELSKTVFADFYRFSHFRSYASVSEYSSAFAPLWPTLIAMVDGAVGTGARTGLYLAFLSYFAFSLTSEHVGQKLTGVRWIGLAMAMILLLGPSMVWNEIEAGRTIPLQLLLYALVLNGLMAGREMNLARALGIGFVAGLAVMNRFDAVLLPVLLALALLWIKRSPACALASLTASIVAVSPWIAYSLSTFGTVFATDNSAVALTLDQNAFVTDWWPAPRPDWSDDPNAWTMKVSGHFGQWIVNGVSLILTPLGAVFVLGVGAAGGVQILCSKAPLARSYMPRSSAIRLAVIFVVILVCMMVPQIVTGYLEYRYYSALLWTSFLGLAAWQIAQGRTHRQRQCYANCFAGLAALWVAGFAAFQVTGMTLAQRSTQADWAQFEAPSDIEVLKQCLGEDRAARVLVMGDDEFAAKAGALASLHTMMEPRNMAEGRLDDGGRAQFLRSWDVKYVFNRRGEGDALTETFPEFEQVADCDARLLKRAY
ncbi:MAG: glycosyltransferase family 2 protein [Erythrobacter sp.]|uniref:glycosyltransferase family 2 protein n=1 Tax=Erythrobacter sp. TaxID=1042 RepID=UPI003298EDFE